GTGRCLPSRSGWHFSLWFQERSSMYSNRLPPLYNVHLSRTVPAVVPRVDPHAARRAFRGQLLEALQQLAADSRIHIETEDLVKSASAILDGVTTDKFDFS